MYGSLLGDLPKLPWLLLSDVAGYDTGGNVWMLGSSRRGPRGSLDEVESQSFGVSWHTHQTLIS